MSRWLVLAGLGIVLMVGLSACSSDDGDPEDFAEFAAKVAQAAEDGDVDFFAGRVAGTPHTCTADEVAESTGPDAPADPICLEEGFEFNQVYIVNYGAPGNTTTEDDLINEIGLFFQGALPDEVDDYGPGSVRLYATARPAESPTDGGDVHTALITAVHNRENVVGRAVRGIDFQLVDGRWVIPGETAASFPTAVDLIEPSSAVILYQDWVKYE
ncbi:MAG: hypothetical protein WEE64_11910 [Dehalococcoidia bacterium]